MNLESIKTAVMTPAVKTLVSTYLLARIYADIKREEVNVIHTQILQDIEIHANTYGRTERLFKMNDLYMCNDDTLCAKIYAEADKRLKAAGIKPADMDSDYCPALTAEHDLVKIEWLILEETAPPLGIDPASLYGKNREQWLHLVISAVINAPDFINPLDQLTQEN